jgi:hypothetical protein
MVVNYVVRWWQSWIPIAFHSTVNRVVNNISNDILLHNHCQYFIFVFNVFASIHTFLLDTYLSSVLKGAADRWFNSLPVKMITLSRDVFDAYQTIK